MNKSMICPKCEFAQAASNTECTRCGIIFEKYRSIQIATNRSSGIDVPEIKASRGIDVIQDLFFYIQPEINSVYLAGRGIVYLVLLIWGGKFIISSPESNYAGESFFHLINLPFHEAGHVFFGLLGRFIGVLGGTLGQVLIPLVCFAVLLIKTRDTFGASVALWWVGESFMDAAPYINDARAGKLILLGGVTGRETVDYHDWEFILRKMDLLHLDHTLAWCSHLLGSFCMIVCFGWGGYLLYKQYQRRKKA